MAKKKIAPTKKTAPPPAQTEPPTHDRDGTMIYGLAKEIGGIAEELDSIKYKFEDMTEALNNISHAIDVFGNVFELAIIAHYGSDEDRAQVVEHFKKSHYTIFPGY